MFLLILGSLTSSAAGLLFTFQYVSINTSRSRQDRTPGNIFTFQYVSINTGSSGRHDQHRHKFTFQYVSINTLMKNKNILSMDNLHSNMFLLIPMVRRTLTNNVYIFTFQYVSINTFRSDGIRQELPEFTFQYVSINTWCFSKTRSLVTSIFTFQYVSINTKLGVAFLEQEVIYIPICFY